MEVSTAILWQVDDHMTASANHSGYRVAAAALWHPLNSVFVPNFIQSPGLVEWSVIFQTTTTATMPERG